MRNLIHVTLAVVMLAAAACSSVPAPIEPDPTQPEAAEEPTLFPTETSEPIATETPSEPPAAVVPEIQLVRSDVQRDPSPEVTQADLADLARGNSRFSFDLYHHLKEGQGNLFYSPYSISLALAMTYAGARGQTENQMGEALHFTLPQDRLHPAFNALDQRLASRGESPEGEDAFELNIVNSIWGQEDYDFLPEFLDALALHYGAGLRMVDFARAAEEARQLINEWVSHQTEQRIEDLLPQGSVDALTRLVLVNAIYFNAQWAHQFDPENTSEGPFYLLDGSETTVPLMQQEAFFPYHQGDGYLAVELPYQIGDLSMLVLVPDEGRFAEFEASLNSDLLAAAAASLESTNLDLTFPSFSFESSFGLSDALASLGMRGAFDPQTADFSGMDGTRSLYITDVVHKAFVEVDEQGTEAAAATGVVVGIVSIPPEPVDVTINRPFIFLIRDLETDTILFIGRVLDPSA
jgi:serpin B